MGVKDIQKTDFTPQENIQPTKNVRSTGKTLGFVLLIIVGIGGIAVGCATFAGAGALSQLTQVHALIAEAAGIGGGIIFVILGSVGTAKWSNRKEGPVVYRVIDHPISELKIDPKLKEILMTTGLVQENLPLPSANEKTQKKPRQKVDSSQVKNVNREASAMRDASEEEVLKLQDKIQNTNTKHKPLNLQSLAECGMLPHHTMTYGNATYYFSDLFDYKSSSKMRLALIEVDGDIYPRLIYQSNSQATWRVLPAMTKGAYCRLGKGHCETDTQLPIDVNLALHALPLEIKQEPFGITDVTRTGHDHTSGWKEEVHENPLIALEEGAKKGFAKGGLMVPNPPDPTSIKLPKSDEVLPNFTNLIKEKTLQVAHYGEITAKVFLSKNKEIKYLFYEAKDGRAYLASVEKIMDNPINTYGVRETYSDLQNLDAPLLEYWDQIPQDYNPDNRDANRYESRKYHSNWNYVRELAIIKLYYSEQSRELPDKV